MHGDLRICSGRGRDRLALEQAEGLLLLAWRAPKRPLCNAKECAAMCQLMCIIHEACIILRKVHVHTAGAAPMLERQ